MEALRTKFDQLYGEFNAEIQKVTLQTFGRLDTQEKQLQELSNFAFQLFKDTETRFQNVEAKFLQEQKNWKTRPMK